MKSYNEERYIISGEIDVLLLATHDGLLVGVLFAPLMKILVINSVINMVVNFVLFLKNDTCLHNFHSTEHATPTLQTVKLQISPHTVK